jgi:hypothetical protein
MGLKTTNYVSKSTGLVLPEAYAVLKNLVIESDNRARAIFAVQASRENAQNYQAIDKVEVRFTWDRKTDPAKMAYEAAKTETRTVEMYNEATHTAIPVTEKGTLFGWEDDIV